MASSSTTSRRRLLAGLGAALAARPHAAAAQPQRLEILYVDREGDPRYRTASAYTGAFQRSLASPFAAAEQALADGAVAARAAGFELVLRRRTLEGEQAAERAAAAAMILDLPLAETEAAARALAAQPVPLFNARHPQDGLRLSACGTTRLFHTLPSTAALTDALAQWLAASDWRKLLLLEGPLDEDRLYAEAVVGSARKFGLRIVERRSFVLGRDPRRRDQSNVKLLTAGADHDIVVLADFEGSFGRAAAYNTQRPRPLAGTHGLQPSAWHAYWERNGAPQLNRRFQRRAGRPMTDLDWATWVAVRAVVDAAIQARTTDSASVLASLTDPALRIELYKAFPGSFRPWSRELRQAVLLGTTEAVIGLAPVEGALHQHNQLDTLGPDAQEFRCGG